MSYHKTYEQSSIRDLLQRSKREKVRATLQLMELRKSRMGISEAELGEDNPERRSVQHVGFSINKKHLPE